MNRLRSLLKVERGEEAPALLLFLYLTLALTSYIIVKAARDALFLNRFSAMTLPYIYIAVAALIGLVVSAYLRVSARLGLSTLITRTLVFFILNVLLLWWAARQRWSPLAAVFYIWSSIFGIIVPTQVWMVANRVLDVRQAKRLFPLISSGGILGSVAGGLIAATVVKWLGTYNLFLVLIPLLALCAFLARRLLRRYALSKSGVQAGVSVPAKKGSLESLARPLIQSRYLRLIAAMLALSAIVTLVIDFQFKIAVQQSVHSRDQLTAFFGSFYAFLNFLALLLQLLAGSRLAEKYGLRMTLFILPTALLTGSVLLLAYPMRLWTALFLKGSDQTLRYSIDKSTVELLYLPVPQGLKAEAKAVIDMMVQRFADGIGGLLLVVMTHVFSLGLAGVGVFNVALISLWLLVAQRARKEYVHALRRSFSPESDWKFAADTPEPTATLRSMLEAHSSVVSVRPEQPTSPLIASLQAPDLKARLSALVRLAQQGQVESNMLRKRLSAIVEELSDTSDEWQDFIEALTEIRDPVTIEFYARLFSHPAPEVRKRAVLSAGRVDKRELVPFLVRLLGDPAVARNARWALRGYGSRILGTLADVMKDPHGEVEIRRNIPRILAYLPNQEAVDVLLGGLCDSDAVVAHRSIRALSKLRLTDSSLRFDQERIGERICEEARKTLWWRRALTCLYPEGHSTDRLAQLLQEKVEHGRDSVFGLLALILPPATVRAAQEALKQEDHLKKANMAEYLDNVLPAKLKEWVLPLVESKESVLLEQQDRREILEVLLKSPEPVLRESTVAAIAQNGWQESVRAGSETSSH